MDSKKTKKVELKLEPEYKPGPSGISMVQHINTSCSDQIPVEEIEFILMRGFDAGVSPVVGELNHWARGEELLGRRRRQEYKVRIPVDFKSHDFLSSLGFPDHEIVFELERQRLDVLLQEALREQARLWATYLSQTQATLIYLTVRHMCSVTNSKQVEYFLHLIEAIANNRLTKVSQLEAFMNVVSRIVNGTTTWKHFRGSKIAMSYDIPPFHFMRKQEVLRIYSYLMRLIKSSDETPHLSEEETKKRRKDLEMRAQIFANAYTAALYRHVPIVALAIVNNIIDSTESIEECTEFLMTIGGERDVELQEIVQLLERKSSSEGLDWLSNSI